MKKTIAFLAACAALSGCAGLSTAWVLHMEYVTPQDKPAAATPAAPFPEGTKT